MAIIFVHAGLTFWVFAALPASAIVAFFLGWWAAIKTASASTHIDTVHTRYFPQKFLTTSVLVRISFISLLGLDLILAKIFLSPSEAGQYALISLVGKIIYFLGSQVSQFILPVVSHHEGQGKDSSKTFYQLLAATVFISITSWIVFALFGSVTAPILFGSKIIPVTGYLPLYGLTIVAFTIGSNIINFHHLRHRYAFPVLGIILSAVQVLLIGLFHRNLSQFVEVIFVFGQLYAFTLLITHLFYSQFRDIFVNLWDGLSVIFTSGNGNKVSHESMRILIFNWRDTRHIWAGGAEVYIHELAKRWVSNSHKVTLFCGNDGKNPREEMVDGIRVVRRGGFFTVYIWAAVYYLLKFRGHYDLIIDSENGIPFFTPLYVRVPKFLLIHHIHQNYFHRYVKFPLKQIAIILESKIMPAVYKNQKIITVSESSKKDIVSLGISQPEDINIINPGVDLTKFIRSPKTDHPSILYLGRIRSYKNIDVAIKAFSQIVRKYPTARFNIAGWGENIDDLKKLVASLRLTRSIKFYERVSETDKVRLLASSWLMVQPSSFEGWGITVIEANASGTPVVASDVVGLRDSVVNQETGMLVAEKNPSDLAAAVIGLIEKPVRLRRLSQNAYTWSKRFDWDKLAESYLSVLARQVADKSLSQPATNLAYTTLYDNQ
jgi:glycosyltransferase involved in cell wall biosynthesis